MGIIKFLYKSLIFTLPLPAEREIKDIPCENYAYFHASSMGEVMSLKPLVEKFSQDYPCIVTVFTKPGKKRAEEFFRGKALIYYFPWDKKYEIEKLLRKAKFVILAESELWPNLLETAFKHKKKIFLVNGKISKQSFYFYNNIFKDIKKYIGAFEFAFLQDKKYEKFYKILGIPEQRIITLKNLKYDSIKKDVEPLFEKKDFIVTFGSVRRDEVNIFIDVIEKILNKDKNLKIIIAPRHLINTGFIESKLKDRGIEYEKRSEKGVPSKRVFILDTIGELIRVWRITDVAIVGGTFGNHGGHNLAEPASLGVPVVFGNSVHNVEEVANKLIKKRGGVKVEGEELFNTLEKLIRDDVTRENMGRNAGKTIESLKGSSETIYNKIKEIV